MSPKFCTPTQTCIITKCTFLLSRWYSHILRVKHESLILLKLVTTSLDLLLPSYFSKTIFFSNFKILIYFVNFLLINFCRWVFHAVAYLILWLFVVDIAQIYGPLIWQLHFSPLLLLRGKIIRFGPTEKKKFKKKIKKIELFFKIFCSSNCGGFVFLFVS